MSAPGRHSAFLAFLCWLAFIIYGSLLPFELRDLSLDEAIVQFQHIRFLDLGVVSRADWIANILLYIPLAYLGCNWIASRRRHRWLTLPAIFVTLGICLSTAVSVEFLQTFFVPRTVSLNDLLAETIGSILGIGIWAIYGARLHRLLRSFADGGRSSVYAAIGIYLLGYLLLALFPFDFVISPDELDWKLSSGQLGWILAGSCDLSFRCAAQLAGELLAIVPLGLLLALTRRPVSLKRVFVAGILFGMVLELMQLLLASGTSQGLSVLLRAAGLAAGVIGGQLLLRHGTTWAARLIRMLTLPLALPYLLAVAALNSWFSAPWMDPAAAIARLAGVRLLPFYYHYFSTETHAVASLLAQFGMYAPVGLAIWAQKIRDRPQFSRKLGSVPNFFRVGLLAAALSTIIELGKLMVPEQHPDPTNLLIAAGGAIFTYWLANWFSSIVDGGKIGDRPQFLRKLGSVPYFSATYFILLVIGITVYPLYPGLLALCLALYLLLLYKHPWAWLFVVPLALPVLDLGLYTGRLLLGEFDLLILATLAMGYWRIHPLVPRPWPRRTLALAVGALWLSWLAAFLHGAWAVQDLPENFIDSAHTPFEAWHVGKGLIWALLLVPLLRRVPKENTEYAQRLLLGGIVAGLTLEVLFILWERHVFVGLGDFDTVFRVTGTFVSMHTGGAYIEAFLAFTTPVVLVRLLQQRHWRGRVIGLLLMAASTYAMFVTYSRGGYAGLLVGLSSVAIATGIQRRRLQHPGRILLAATAVGALGLGIPLLSGQFAQQRLERSWEDLNIRLSHWRQAVSFMDADPFNIVVGAGFGTYPTRYLYRVDSDRTPASFNILKEGKQHFLRLTPGDALYLEQPVSIQAGQKYSLRVHIRQPAGKTELSIPLCEKDLLYSFDCRWYRLSPDRTGNAWQTLGIGIDSGSLGTNGNWPYRPVKLSLYNSGRNNPVDIEQISLQNGSGEELLRNGSFDAGAQHWLFVTDRDLAWHIHQQEIETYFAQGVAGLFALGLLLFGSARVLRRGILGGDPFATAISGALAGFLTVGLLGSTVDSARSSLLLYLGTLAGALLTEKGRRRRLYPHRHPASES